MSRARDLAALFDRSFMEPLVLDRRRGAIALTIFAGGAPYLIKLSDVTLVASTPKIVPLPDGSPLQLGIAGIRGTLFTVFSLTALLGQGASPSTQDAPWLAVVRGIAIAFDNVDGQIELTGSPPNLLDVDALLAKVRA